MKVKTLPVPCLEPGYIYSLTFSCHKNLSLFVDKNLYMILLDSLDTTRSKYQFYLIAWVVMPNHVHLLLSPTVDVKSADLARDLKQKVGFRGARYLKENHPNIADKLVVMTGSTRRTRFWLHRTGHVRRINDIDDIHVVVDYIHRNPERWGLVNQPEDWAYSSAAYWILGHKSGIIPNPPAWLMDQEPRRIE